MNIIEDKQFLKRLFEASGVSGNEDEAGSIAVQALKRLSNELITDRLGSTVAVYRSKHKAAKRVLLLAHIDEVGFIVNRIHKNGTLGVIPVGGLDVATLFGQRLKMIGLDGTTHKGSFHYSAASFDQRKTPTKFSDLVADFGFAEKAAAEKAVRIGTPLAFDAALEFIGADRGMAKAVDDRLGFLAVLGAAQQLKEVDLPFDLYFGFSVQEEVGLRGAKTLAQLVAPDFAIVSDVSNALDASGKEDNGAIGKGVQFRPRDAASIQRPVINHWYMDLLLEHKLPWQPLIGIGGTDAGAIHLSGIGVPTLQVGLVARDIHSASTVFSFADLAVAAKTIALAVKKLDLETIERFKR